MQLKIYEPDISLETFSLEEAAKSLRVPTATLITMIGDWVIETRRIDHEYRIDRNILQREKYVVTITADSTTAEKVIWAKINAQWGGLYLRKDNKLDKNTDIYVTILERRTLPEIKEIFSGKVLYLVRKKDLIILPEGHKSTTVDELPRTLRAMASVIRCEQSKK